jgi:hypothetical protein
MLVSGHQSPPKFAEYVRKPRLISVVPLTIPEFELRNNENTHLQPISVDAR